MEFEGSQKSSAEGAAEGLSPAAPLGVPAAEALRRALSEGGAEVSAETVCGTVALFEGAPLPELTSVAVALGVALSEVLPFSVAVAQLCTLPDALPLPLCSGEALAAAGEAVA